MQRKATVFMKRYFIGLRSITEGAHPASFPMGTRGLLPPEGGGGKAVGA